MHWCEAVKRKSIDCGTHAALALEAFRARGLTAFPAQLVQRYSEEATEQWRGKWAEEDVSCHWLDGEHIYHEATALLVGEDEVKIWDSSAGSWVGQRQDGGYAASPRCGSSPRANMARRRVPVGRAPAQAGGVVQI